MPTLFYVQCILAPISVDKEGKGSISALFKFEEMVILMIYPSKLCTDTTLKYKGIIAKSQQKTKALRVKIKDY